MLKRLSLNNVIAILFLMLCEPLFNWWRETWIASLWSNIQPSCFNDILALLFVAFGSTIAVMLPKYLSDTGIKWTRIFSGWFLFVLLVESIRFNSQFVHFHTFPWFRYTDVFVPVITAFWLASCVLMKNSKKESETKIDGNQNLLYDDVDEQDFLDRGKLVEHICNVLQADKGNCKGATGVAITGDWGSGKSWMMYQTKRKLEESNEICIVFKPWLYGESDMTRQFYLTMERQLKLHGLKVDELKNAVAEIDNEKMVGLGKAFLSLFGIVTKNGGRDRSFELIKEKLDSTNNKFFVFIDDCDRLAKKELMQVLSLIRNTGDLPGVVYFMAFDNRIVESVVGEEIGINYVGKMFNLTIDLPPMNDNVVASYLDQAVRHFMADDLDDDNPFIRIPVAKLLPTIREAKKYLNLLLSDYKHLHSRFENCYYYASDFCLLELLKYKNSDLYYELQSNPDAYLFLKNKGWNGDAYNLKEEKCNCSTELLVLLKELFKTKTNYRNSSEIIGVANKEYFYFYFEKEINGKYVNGKEFDKAVAERTLPQKVGEWVDMGYKGVLDMFCAIHDKISRYDVFLAMANYIWHECERGRANANYSNMTYGYDKKEGNHSFKSIMEVIGRTSQIEMIAAQHFSIEDGNSEGDDIVLQLIQESEYTKELMGIWLNELKQIEEDDFQLWEVSYYIKKLWDKVVEKVNDGTIGTADVMDMLGACTLDDTFQRMVLPLVTDNPQRWLGATIIKITDNDKEYYLLKSRWIHSVFGSLDKMYAEMDAIVKMSNDINKKYVNEYSSLINRLSYMSKYELDPSSFEKDRYPALADSEILGSGAAMPVGYAIKQLKNQPFWRGNNLRIHREKSEYFFETEI